MPPKKKGKKAGSALIDGVDTSSMTREQLEAFAHRLKNEMEREREERNFFQLERDKLRTFWEITREKLEEAEAIIRNKDREIEETKEISEIDVKHVIQQMKHLQYENQAKIGEIRAESMTQLKLAQEDHVAQEAELLKDKRELRRLLREKEETFQLQMQQLNMSHSAETSKLQQNFENEIKELHEWQDEKLKDYKYDIDLKHKLDINEITERKNLQIKKLIEENDRSLNEIKNYYNDIITNNLSLISSLKEQMEELRKKFKNSEKRANEIYTENENLIIPLKNAQTELDEYKKKLIHFERDKEQLTRFKLKLNQLTKKINNQKFEIEALLMRNDTLIEERNHLKKQFEETIMEFQQKTGLKNVLLEHRLKILQNEAETREVLLNEALIATGTDPQQLSTRIDTLLQDKNSQINDLHYELLKICKLYNDLLMVCQKKFDEKKISKDDLIMFEPLPIDNYKEIKFEKDFSDNNYITSV